MLRAQEQPWREEVAVILAALQLRPAAEMDRGPLGEPDRRQPGARAGDDAAHRLRCRWQAARRARRLQLQQRRLSARRGLPTSPCICSCGRPTRCRITASHAGLVQQHGRTGRLSRALGDGIAGRARPRSTSRRGRSESTRSRSGAAIWSPLQTSPTDLVLGIPLEDITPAECLEKLLAKFDVAAFRAEQAAARTEGRYLGLGIAAYIEPTGSAGSIAMMTGELAQMRIEPTGKVTAMMSTHSQGHGTPTTMAQVHRRPARRGIRGCHGVRGRQFARRILPRRGRQPAGRDRRRRRDQGCGTSR